VPPCGLGVEGRFSRTTARETGRRVRLSGTTLHLKRLVSSQIIAGRTPKRRVRWGFHGDAFTTCQPIFAAYPLKLALWREHNACRFGRASRSQHSRCSATFLCSPGLNDLSEGNPWPRTSVRKVFVRCSQDVTLAHLHTFKRTQECSWEGDSSFPGEDQSAAANSDILMRKEEQQ
jgi:hypothetical protein